MSTCIRVSFAHACYICNHLKKKKKDICAAAFDIGCIFARISWNETFDDFDDGPYFFPEFTCSAGTNFFCQRMGTRYTRILVCIQTDHSGCILQCIKLNIDMRTCLFAVTVYHLLTIVNVILRHKASLHVSKNSRLLLPILLAVYVVTEPCVIRLHARHE